MKYLLIIFFLFLSFDTRGSDFKKEPITPLKDTLVPYDSEKAELGMLLFKDRRLSRNNTISCASCHNLFTNGADTGATSLGIGGQKGRMNTPTVFNSSLNFVQFWDGRARNLNEQIDGPIHDEKEMGTNWPEIIKKLSQDTYYLKQFEKLYVDGLNQKNIKNAIEVFEKQLITLNSPFDRYLAGDTQALNEREIQGYNRFKSLGCIACHQGHNIGGNMFQTMGVMGDYFKNRKTPISKEDLGRYNVTRVETDKFVFRVPSLRNVALTAPYFHDGSAHDLHQAVKIMALYQLGQKLQPEETNLIVEFLKTLTGQKPKILQKTEK